jgi:hypothetical protein
MRQTLSSYRMQYNGITKKTGFLTSATVVEDVIRFVS